MVIEKPNSSPVNSADIKVNKDATNLYKKNNIMMKYKTTLENIKNNLYNILPLFIQFYLTFMGFFWIIIFCYLRFITPSTSYTLEALKTQITLRYYITFSIFIIIHCTLIILILYNKYKKKEENETIIKKIIEIFQIILNNVFWKPLEYIHNLIAPNLPLSARIFLYIESIWTKKNVDHTYFYSLIYCIKSNIRTNQHFDYKDLFDSLF